MQKIFLGIAALVTISFSSVVAQQQNGSLEKTLLWKITGNGIERPSYLFGTMHLLCASDAFLSEELQNALAECDTVYFEIDLDDQKQLFSALRHLQMNDGVQLSDLLNEEEYKRVQDYFRNRNFMIPFSLMKRFKPFLISSMMSEQFMDCPEKEGMEQVIMSAVKKLHKPIKGLETIAFQASLFDSIPYEEQAKELITYLDSAEHYAISTRKMIEVYRSQDLQKMEELVRISDPGTEKYLDLLLYGRNRRWAEQLTHKLNGSPCVYAVGAGHLPGEQGLIRLLQNKGYKVTPVRNSRNRSL
jgi:uncharacterized protein YbaP (TraB family)